MASRGQRTSENAQDNEAHTPEHAIVAHYVYLGLEEDGDHFAEGDGEQWEDGAVDHGSKERDDNPAPLGFRQPEDAHD